MDFFVTDDTLRMADAQTGEPILRLAEEKVARKQAEEARREAEARAQDLRAEVERLRAALERQYIEHRAGHGGTVTPRCQSRRPPS